ncbi:MAG: DUF4292 domain-containing protein [Flavobacteriales bacterium]
MSRSLVFIFLIAGIGLSACAKKLVSPVVIESVPATEPIEALATSGQMLDSIQKQPWKYFSTKLDVNYSNNEKSITVKANVKSTKDSASFFIVSFLNLPVVLAMATHDSIMYVDKTKRCYEQKNLQELQSLFGITLTLTNLEELLLAFPIGFNVENPNQEKTSDTLWVYQTQKENNKTRLHTYALSQKEHRLLYQCIKVPEDEITLSISYTEYILHSAMALPTSLSMKLEVKNQESNIQFTYGKTTFDNPMLLELNMPDDYENCP